MWLIVKGRKDMECLSSLFALLLSKTMIRNKYTGLHSIGIYEDKLSVYRIVAAYFKPY